MNKSTKTIKLTTRQSGIISFPATQAFLDTLDAVADAVELSEQEMSFNATPEVQITIMPEQLDIAFDINTAGSSERLSPLSCLHWLGNALKDEGSATLDNVDVVESPDGTCDSSGAISKSSNEAIDSFVSIHVPKRVAWVYARPSWVTDSAANLLMDQWEEIAHSRNETEADSFLKVLTGPDSLKQLDATLTRSGTAYGQTHRRVNREVTGDSKTQTNEWYAYWLKIQGRHQA